jgi:hypothetical protein
MKRRRGIPGVTVCAVLLFGGAVAVWLFMALATSPATAYAHAPACTHGTSAPSGCRTTVAATVTATGFFHVKAGASWVRLSGAGVPSATQSGTAGAWSALKKGEHVRVAMWAGQVVSVTGGASTAFMTGDPPPDEYSVGWIPVCFLAASFALARMYRDPLVGGRWSRPLRFADRTTLPALAAAVLALAIRPGAVTTAAMALVGTVAGLCLLPGMAWNRDEPSPSGPATRPGRRAARPTSGVTGAASVAVVRPPACPVDPVQQRWIEDSMQWFAREFGESAALGEVALPVPEFYPVAFAARPDQIRQQFRRVCRQMNVNPWRVILILRDKSGAGLGVRRERGRVLALFHKSWIGPDRIQLDTSSLADPLLLTAALAHELGHERLLGEGRVTTAREDHERLTDLITVYFGLGVFNANAAVTHWKAGRRCTATPVSAPGGAMLSSAEKVLNLGYLDKDEFGYGLACWARLRGEREPRWMRYLNPAVRASMKQGLAYLALRDRTDVEA